MMKIDENEWDRNMEAYSNFIERKIREYRATQPKPNYDNWKDSYGMTHCGRPHDPTHKMHCACIGMWR